MKRYLASIIVLLLFATISYADEIKYLTSSVSRGGKTYKYTITTEMMEKSPAWKLDEEIPLQPHEAAAIAQKYVAEKYPKFDLYKIFGMHLSLVWSEDIENRWYYTVEGNAIADVDGLRASTHLSVIVTMDGTVIEPAVTDSAEASDLGQ